VIGPRDLWRGEVLAVDGGRCTIKIPRLNGDRTLTGVRFVIPIGGPDTPVGATSVSVGEESLALRPLEVGDEVLVGLLEGSRDAPVVLGRLS
jgi:hypothetical protein